MTKISAVLMEVNSPAKNIRLEVGKGMVPDQILSKWFHYSALIKFRLDGKAVEMYVNENGLAMGLPHNLIASALLRAAGNPAGPVVGPAIVFTAPDLLLGKL